MYFAETIDNFFLEKCLLNRKMQIYIDSWFNKFKRLSKFFDQFLVYAKLCSLFLPPELYPFPAQQHSYWKEFTNCAIVRLKSCVWSPPRPASCPAKDTDFSALECPLWQVPVLKSNKK